MQPISSMRLPVDRTAVAPDGSDVRVLLSVTGGGMAHFELKPSQVSKAVTHRNVEELWYFLTGHGEMWLQHDQDDSSEIVKLEPGVCLAIPLGTRFQFRTIGDEPLSAVGVTMPPWPGGWAAVVVNGPWEPRVPI